MMDNCNWSELEIHSKSEIIEFAKNRQRIINQLKADNEALKERLSGTCIWVYEGNDEYTTECGQSWIYLSDGPKANHQRYCHSCDVCEAVSDTDSKWELQQERVEFDKWRRTSYICEDVPDSSSKGLERQWEITSRVKPQHNDIGNISWWATEPKLGRVAHGVANRVDRLRAIGNGQVPAVVRAAWQILTN